MVCRECGCEQVPGQFCRQCGTRAIDPPPLYAAASPAGETGTPPWQENAAFQAGAFARGCGQRVQKHVQVLGVLWCAYGGVRVVTGILALTALRTIAAGSFVFLGTVPDFVPHLVRGFGPLLAAAMAALGMLEVVTGCALLLQKPWARVLAIVVGVRSLIKPPLGTALGIYTLWVLAPAISADEWQRMQHAGQVHPA